MPPATLSLDEAVDLTRTGDLWIFRGRSVPDRAIQSLTNSPVNHVGMALVVEDMPPLMWHAELGRSLPDMWSGTRQRGVQLHDLRDAVLVWGRRYGQRGWLRQLQQPVTPAMEDAALRTVARLDGTPFPSSAQLAWRWVRGRVPQPRRLPSLPSLPSLKSLRWRGEVGAGDATGVSGEAALETAYCAEVVAVTYEAMGLLPSGRKPNWYDPGRFWSGDELELCDGYTLGDEIAVELPPR
ncbi:hypothetical protein [Spirilliplanes yamanashiensis]|uniref:Guanylate cyclase n=1 Tax=Spirilliplanes yamanashiensis TaxID=42233 RepID=A0A8J3YC83_9ACTN|nr:hypothetical protein [Spirilliplanes yamanashiensis]MDP9818861.1 hypothetical protein [Spirilliplanes yamanashiensis]GIJ05315.1 hypothetical protein Sya03_46670 [Spirilliplanes yamanashiensis]